MARPPLHGLGTHKYYSTWCGMRSRCCHPADAAYPRYGGRGIGMYEPWQAGPTEFIQWLLANLGERPAGHSLDRIDNDGNYEPGNLRWADRTTQRRNARNVTTLEVARKVRDLYAQGGTTQQALAIKFGISRETVSAITLGRIFCDPAPLSTGRR